MQIHSIERVLSDKVRIGAEICVKGWLRSIRTSKGGFSFLSLHDGSCFHPIQIVVDSKLANYDEVVNLSTGCAVSVMGNLVESRGRNQSVEVQASAVVTVGTVADAETYPIAKKRHSFEYLRTVAHLRPRTNTFGAMARVRHQTAKAVHDYFDRNGFFWVNTPIITASDCEGAGELFRVSSLDLVNTRQSYQDDFFGQETFLAVSGQLNVESYCLALSKVYTFGPTFRAENSNTSRHLAEFWMIEPEIAFADINDNADLAEDFLHQVLAQVLEKSANDLEFFNQFVDKEAIARMQSIVESQFVRITYTEAIDELQKASGKFEFPASWGSDLQSEHERYLTETVFNAPVIVMNYPKTIKPFYMRLNDDDKTVAAMDVLVSGVGEIVGGSQREERLDVLESRMNQSQADELWWYRDLRRYGTVPHAGFGVGFERILLYMTGMENIRDVIPFPRVPNNASF